MPVNAFGSVWEDGRLGFFFCVICLVLARAIDGELAAAAPWCRIQAECDACMSGLGQDVRRRGARYTSVEVSQFPPVTGDGCIGGSQKHFELLLSHQVTLHLQDQLRERGAISHRSLNLVATSRCALF